MSNDIKKDIEFLIDLIDDNFEQTDGPSKVALLRTVAAYYESLTVAQATSTMIYNSLNKL